MKKHNIQVRGKRAFAFLPFYLLAFLLFSACAHEEDDLFPESAAQRINHSVSYYQSLLKSSDNGWVLDYLYYDGKSGGVLYTVKFSDEEASMAAADLSFINQNTQETFPAGTEIPVKYSVKEEQGVILSFDTYSRTFHYFSEPMGSSAPDGLESDYEFIIQHASENEDTLYLKGKKHGLNMIMYKLKDMDAKTFTERVNTMQQAVFTLNLDTITVGDKQYKIQLSRLFQLNKTEEDSIVENLWLTSDGFRVENPIEINGHSFQTFTIDHSSGRFVSADGDAFITLPSAKEQFENPNHQYGWKFVEGSMNHEMDSLYENAVHFEIALPSAMAKFDGIYLASSEAATEYDRSLFKQVIMMTWQLYSAYYWYFRFPANYGVSFTLNDDNEIEIKGIGEGDGYDSGMEAYWRLIVNPFVNYLCEHSPYKATFNDGSIKSEVNLVSRDNPNVRFSLQFTDIQISQRDIIK